MKCFYCEAKGATGDRFGKPSCDDCHSTYLLGSVKKLRGTLPDNELAERYKVILKSFI